MVRFKVPAMTCGGCASSITKAIQSVDPAAKIDTDVPERLVTVETAANEQSLVEVIREAGYDAEAA